MKKNLRAIVVGAGSIGKRHLRNLKSLGIARLVVCDPFKENRSLIQEELSLTEAYEDLTQANLQKGDIVFICSPNHLHAQQALYAAEHDCDVFVEKPLAHTLEHTDKLCELAAQKKLITLCGCNMRFYPAIKAMKTMLNENVIGKVLSFRVTVGIYLPNWRPHLDYRKNYGAHQSQGGGAILDMIHEIDYSRWLFGDPSEVIAAYGKVSNLEIDTEDIAEMTYLYPEKIGNIHLDYLSHRYTRMVHAIGEKGDLFWEWHKMGVEHFDAATKKQTFHPNPENYNLNEMYLEETKYFLDCIENRKETFFSFFEATRVLEIALAAKESHIQGQKVSLKNIKAHAAK